LAIVADASGLIHLQRRGQLKAFLAREQVAITERIKQELVDIPLKKAPFIRSPELKVLVERSAEEIRDLIEEGRIKVMSINYRKYSKLLDRVKEDIAAIEGLQGHQVKADHTLVVLAIQVAEQEGVARVVSMDRTINGVLMAISKERGLRIEFMKL
jgi:hypothetical protein